MEIRSIRLSKRTKDQLSRLKRRTGIPTYNVLCRWALCLSLSEPRRQSVQESVNRNAPSPVIGHSSEDDIALEIDWRILGGEHSDIYIAAIKQTRIENGLSTDTKAILDEIKLHTENGVKQLVANDEIKNIECLLELALIDNNSNLAPKK